MWRVQVYIVKYMRHPKNQTKANLIPDRETAENTLSCAFQKQLYHHTCSEACFVKRFCMSLTSVM